MNFPDPPNGNDLITARALVTDTRALVTDRDRAVGRYTSGTKMSTRDQTGV